MTQVARVFVVLNLLLAAGFLFSAATILSLNHDWKAKYENEARAHETTRETLDKKIAALTSERDDFRRAGDQLKEENAGLMATNSTLKQQIDALTAETKNKDTANNQLRQTLDNLQATLDRVTRDLERLQAESKANADDARKARDEAKAARDELVAERKKIRELTALRDELQATVQSLRETIKEKDVMIDFARRHGISFENLVVMDPVRGAVVRADNETRLAVVNVGSKQGVKRGYVLDITRGSTYVGRMIIDTVYENAAAGTIKFLAPGEMVRAGDLVTNTLD